MSVVKHVVLAAAMLQAPAVMAQQVSVDITAQAPAVAAPVAPPPPPMAVPAPARVAAPVVVAPAAPEGQWVYTRQYAWVYMPYAQSYTYVPPAGHPQMFVFYPNYGWRWVVAPWIFGGGPAPYWGPHGYGRFAWYARPWFAPRAVVRRHWGHRRGYVVP
jgi:hypothetical protein